MPEENESTEFESTNEGVVEPTSEDAAPESKVETGGESGESSQEGKKAEADETTGEEKKEVGFSDFLKARGVEIDKIDTEDKKQEPKKKEVQTRTFDDIAEEDRPLFKAMSNDSFNKLKPIYLEHKQLKVENETLKSRKPEGSASIYGHPQAFVLTKEYSTHSNDAALAEKIKSHWALQSAKVSRGEKWQDLDMDPKTGKLVLSEPKESNAEAEAFIGDQLQFAREQTFDANKKLKSYIDNYGNTYNQDLQVVQAATEKYFPGYSDPKHATQPIQKAVIEALPVSFRDNPVAQLLAMTAANNAILMGRLKKALSEINKLKGIEDDTNKAQPRKGEFVNGKNTGGVVKYSSFAERRAQGD